MSEQSKEPVDKPALWGMPRNIIVTGIVSFLMDVSSEMVYVVTPLFLEALGVSKKLIGTIEGAAEATAAIFKLLSGYLADKVQRYKPLVTLGYLISALSRPLVALARGAGLVLAGRMMDRFGKGVRTAPRDAIIAASSRRDSYGKSFGFHRAMDQAGAVLGPGLAFIVLYFGYGKLANIEASGYRGVLWLSLVPGILAVIATRFLRETGQRRVRKAAESAEGKAAEKTPGISAARYFYFLAVMLVFSLGNSSNIFLFLRATDLGVAACLVPLAYATMNFVCAGASIPWGIWADRVGFRPVIMIGFGVYVAVYIWLAEANAAWMIWAIFPIYGLFESAFEGQSRAYLAKLSKRHLHGTAFGLYHSVLAFSMLLASVIAGTLWEWDHPANANHSFPFYFGAAMAGLALVMLAIDPLFFRERRTAREGE